MNIPRALKPTRFAPAILALGLLTTPAFAVNKDMVQLQTQIQELQDSVARLQQSNDERMGVLKDLVQQTADAVNKMTTTVDNLQQKMASQQETANGKVDQVSGQVQSLNDSLDEVKARLNAMEKALQGVQGQQQSINATLQNLSPSGAGNVAPGAAPAPPSGPGQAAVEQPPTQVAAAPEPDTKPSADIPFATQQGAPIVRSTNAPTGAPPVGDLYRTALADYMAAKYGLALNEFSQLTHSYPSDAMSGNAFYYLGEIYYRQGKYAAAIKSYEQVIAQFPGSTRVPVSHLHKATALLALKERDAGIEEMRSLIQRFPNSPEAAQARAKLNGLGVSAAVKRSE